MDIGATAPIDRHVESIVEVMLDATTQHEAPLTEERLFGWHVAPFPTGRSGLRKITVGNWRTLENVAMQVVSGPIGREKVHYEAPAAGKLAGQRSAVIYSIMRTANGVGLNRMLTCGRSSPVCRT